LAIDATGRRMDAALADAHYVEVEGGPHRMLVTHAADVNRELLGVPRPAGQRRRRPHLVRSARGARITSRAITVADLGAVNLFDWNSPVLAES
jgi:hypothetical protein